MSRFRKEFLPPARSFFEKELGPLGRPNRKGWALGNCPFHKSKSRRSFAVNLDSGAFRCFGCDVRGGDIVSFVMVRDAIPFRIAAQHLGAWQDVSGEQRAELTRQMAKKKKEREQLAKVKEVERIKLLELRDEIHFLAAIQRETSERLRQLLQGAEAVCEDEAERCWDVLSLVLDDLRLTEDEYMNLAGLDGAA